jgi:diguanylate cyclase (GGDEF)-like protein
VLREVAAAFDRASRIGDAVARVGGDEFAVLLPGAGEPEAARIADRLRAACETIGDDLMPLSLSVGVAVAPWAGDSLEELWHAADRAMYDVKRTGGDGVASAQLAA